MKARIYPVACPECGCGLWLADGLKLLYCVVKDCPLYHVLFEVPTININPIKGRDSLLTWEKFLEQANNLGISPDESLLAVEWYSDDPQIMVTRVEE